MNSAVDTALSDTHVASSRTQALQSTDFPGLREVETIEAAITAERIRRVLNVSIAILLLVVFAPLMLAIAVLVKLSSPGPIIYRQSRVGVDRRDRHSRAWDGRRRIDYGGRLFTIYKFRTMRPAPRVAQQVWARPDDCRITPIGRILRAYRLDELPQLVNVLKGDMNIVGPRPEQPKIFMDLRDVVDGYSDRQRVLPGITGWAQVNLSYDHSLETVKQKVKFDLEYIHQCSPWQDLRILFRTVPVMIFKRGAW